MSAARRESDAPLPPAQDEAGLESSPLTVDPFTPGMLPVPRWFGATAALCALALIPWIVYLALELPTQAKAAHYDVTWVGFDIGIFLLLGSTALATYRRSTWTEPLAAATALLLVTDAWFDVTAAGTRGDRMAAVASAVVIELPLAVLCGRVALNTERIRRRAYRRLWHRAITAESLLDGRPDAGQPAEPSADVRPPGPAISSSRATIERNP